jgi:hypothetical protein
MVVLCLFRSWEFLYSRVLESGAIDFLGTKGGRKEGRKEGSVKVFARQNQCGLGLIDEVERRKDKSLTLDLDLGSLLPNGPLAFAPSRIRVSTSGKVSSVL